MTPKLLLLISICSILQVVTGQATAAAIAQAIAQGANAGAEAIASATAAGDGAAVAQGVAQASATSAGSQTAASAFAQAIASAAAGEVDAYAQAIAQAFSSTGPGLQAVAQGLTQVKTSSGCGAISTALSEAQALAQGSGAATTFSNAVAVANVEDCLATAPAPAASSSATSVARAVSTATSTGSQTVAVALGQLPEAGNSIAPSEVIGSIAGTGSTEARVDFIEYAPSINVAAGASQPGQAFTDYENGQAMAEALAEAIITDGSEVVVVAAVEAIVQSIGGGDVAAAVAQAVSQGLAEAIGRSAQASGLAIAELCGAGYGTTAVDAVVLAVDGGHAAAAAESFARAIGSVTEPADVSAIAGAAAEACAGSDAVAQTIAEACVSAAAAGGVIAAAEAISESVASDGSVAFSEALALAVAEGDGAATEAVAQGLAAAVYSASAEASGYAIAYMVEKGNEEVAVQAIIDASLQDPIYATPSLASAITIGSIVVGQSVIRAASVGGEDVSIVVGRAITQAIIEGASSQSTGYALAQLSASNLQRGAANAICTAVNQTNGIGAIDATVECLAEANKSLELAQSVGSALAEACDKGQDCVEVIAQACAKAAAMGHIVAVAEAFAQVSVVPGCEQAFVETLADASIAESCEATAQAIAQARSSGDANVIMAAITAEAQAPCLGNFTTTVPCPNGITFRQCTGFAGNCCKDSSLIRVGAVCQASRFFSYAYLGVCDSDYSRFLLTPEGVGFQCYCPM